MSNHKADTYRDLALKAINEKYDECLKEKLDLNCKIGELYLLLMSKDSSKLPYDEHTKITKEIKLYETKIKNLSIKLDVWSEAKELCMRLL